MNLNLEALGVTKESLINGVLAQTGLSAEDAVLKLANELGVEIAKAPDVRSTTISDGDSVLTSAGESRAAILTAAELATLKEAAAIQTRLFA